MMKSTGMDTLSTPTRTNVTAAHLQIGDVLRRDGLKYRVTAAPEVVERYASGEPAAVRVPVVLVNSGIRDTLLFEADESLIVSRQTL